MYSNRSITNGDEINGQLVVNNGIDVNGDSTFQSITITSPLDANNNKIINLADPTAKQDAASKNYVDTFVQGLQAKQAVVVATTTALPTYTFSSNSLIGTGALPAIDGVTLTGNDRVLVKNETTNAQYNGIYFVESLNPWTLTRIRDGLPGKKSQVAGTTWVRPQVTWPGNLEP